MRGGGLVADRGLCGLHRGAGPAAAAAAAAAAIAPVGRCADGLAASDLAHGAGARVAHELAVGAAQLELHPHAAADARSLELGQHAAGRVVGQDGASSVSIGRTSPAPSTRTGAVRSLFTGSFRSFATETASGAISAAAPASTTGRRGGSSSATSADTKSLRIVYSRGVGSEIPTQIGEQNR